MRDSTVIAIALCLLPLLSDLLHDLIEEVVQKFMSVLVHSRPEYGVEFLEFVDECAGSDGSFFIRILVDTEEQGLKGGEKGRR